MSEIVMFGLDNPDIPQMFLGPDGFKRRSRARTIQVIASFSLEFRH